MATSFVIAMVRGYVKDLLVDSNNRCLNGDFSMIDILHHFTSGFKSMCANYAYYGIDELRQACGGAGYTLSSGIADTWNDIAPYSTFEGVNVVMTQQSSKYLFKQIKKVSQGKKSEGFFSYINDLEKLCNLKQTADNIADFGTLKNLDKCMAVNAAA